MAPSTRFELEGRRAGFKLIAGVDEAGRGPLAGPVVAASCILPARFSIKGIKDSKELPREERSRLFEELIRSCRYGVSVVSHTVIDEVNILQATLKAMAEAVAALSDPTPDLVLIDGNQLPKLASAMQAIVKGDSLSLSIAAASIIAKESRDRIMDDYHKLYPEYGFDRHKGYGTALHRERLAELGPCPIHRRSFNPANYD